MTAPLVEIRGLSAHYPGASRAALDGIDLTVAPGEFVLLAGASGSGKSSLLALLAGLLPQATGGTVRGTARVGGLDLSAASLEELGRTCAYVGQEPERQVVMTTPRAELAIGAELRGSTATAVRRVVEEVALALGLEAVLDRDLATLSGGELQRVALGAALTQEPELLVLDEPTSQLDPVAGDELLGLLRRLNREWGLTVVLAEHRLERCLDAADRVVALRRGRVAFDGTPDAFCSWAPTQAPELATSASTVLHVLDPALAGEAVSVRRARAALAGGGWHATPPDSQPTDAPLAPRRLPMFRRARAARDDGSAAMRVSGLWRSHGGRDVLRGLDLSVAPGEAVALMGRNGAGKSTLLRVIAGLDAPNGGEVVRRGRVALVLQRSTDHLLHQTVAEELPPGVALGDLRLDDGDGDELAGRHPGDLSGGQQQVLATAVVCGGEPPAVLCLDEPTRGLDRVHRARLARELARRRAAGTATIVATHDPEFAALVADRVVLLGEGVVLADGPTGDVLVGGWYFATEVARLLRTPGIVTPAQATAALVNVGMRPDEVGVPR